ncbi:2-methylisoborneol synthase [Kitasatospora herbaricolor]|uniref:family 2 encapsulin nanocompartment cargo protein terpene cyclase n=1 Tax=Kitasatospora herbaricolor TaxID=68217 RepID=UPI00174BD06D|nr:family 2 encapsulin nanocompartment cargo protein terpene cyclase [Kitasatospora herbaricolor]MDQ0306510.1 2-methylisoborneol synthase [Kitasatospora herbaricolor]GGV34470.1 2-methylisoborneol synthase [Kitasatospora herbaricolor]
MPDPGLSPLQSSLPAAAARFGTHILAGARSPGPEPVAGTRSALPSLPGRVFAPVPAAGEAPVAVPAPLVPDAPGGGPAARQVVEGAAEVGRSSPVLDRILRGPSGLGTSSLHPALREEPAASGAPVAGRPIPGLYHHPVPEPDPARVEEVSRRIKAWALDEVQLFPEDWEDQFDGFSVGRYMVGCHPDAPTVDHLMVATRLMVAENAVDDCYCEDHGGSPVGLGGRLLLAHTALDPLQTTTEYRPQWAQSLHADAPRRAYRSAMEYFVQRSTPSQADRFRHDMARLHLGYLAEAAWAQTDHVPEVWEYLAMRQFNNFRPCPTITDTVGGYELPADLHAQPAMQRVLALAGNATTIVNDLYSYTKELAGPGRHLNLPVVIAEREGVSDQEAYLKAVEVHNDLMRAFEDEAAALAAACPAPTVLRFLRGVAVWVDGNHHWHRTNTFRYSLPDFW